MAKEVLKILPDLSLVVEMESGEDAASVNAAVAAFAEPIDTTATSSRYRITAASVWQARRQGLSLAAILDSLETHSQTQIPAKLRADMVLWSTQIDRLRLQAEDGQLILRSHNPAAIADVLRRPSLQTFITHQIDASSLALNNNSYPEVVAAFDAAQQPVLDQVQAEMLRPVAEPETPRRRQKVKKTALRRATKKRRLPSPDVPSVLPPTLSPTGQAKPKGRFIEEFGRLRQQIPSQCQAPTKTGRQCRNRARLPSTFCQVHADWVAQPDQDFFHDSFDVFSLPAYMASALLYKLIEDGVISLPQLALVRMFLLVLSGLAWWLLYVSLMVLNDSWLHLPLAAWFIAGLAFGLMCWLLGRVIADSGPIVGLHFVRFFVESLLFDCIDKEGLMLNLCFFLIPVVIPAGVVYYYALSGWWGVLFFPLGLLFGRFFYHLFEETSD